MNPTKLGADLAQMLRDRSWELDRFDGELWRHYGNDRISLYAPVAGFGLLGVRLRVKRDPIPLSLADRRAIWLAAQGAKRRFREAQRERVSTLLAEGLT